MCRRGGTGLGVRWEHMRSGSGVRSPVRLCSCSASTRAGGAEGDEASRKAMSAEQRGMLEEARRMTRRVPVRASSCVPYTRSLTRGWIHDGELTAKRPDPAGGCVADTSLAHRHAYAHVEIARDRRAAREGCSHPHGRERPAGWYARKPYLRPREADVLRNAVARAHTCTPVFPLL